MPPCGPGLAKGCDGLRIAVAGGYFAKLGLPQVFEPVAKAARALGVSRTIRYPMRTRPAPRLTSSPPVKAQTSTSRICARGRRILIRWG